MSAPLPEPERAAWGARFGWFVGGALGLLAGFLATYALEVWVLASRSQDPTRAASRTASVIVPAFFIAGALAGHTLGGRGGGARYKYLGAAAGVCIAALGWSLLALTR
jgi:hypothetical protein